MEIIQIEGPYDKRGVSHFLEVATKVYEHDPIWVPQSETAFTQRFEDSSTQKRYRMWPIIALEDNSPVARAVAILATNAMDEVGHCQGWIGFFEVLKEYQATAKCVLQRCEAILQVEGAQSVLAPKVDSLLVGLLTDGFGLPQTVLTNHNPPYYLGVFQDCGYEVYSRMRTFYFTRETVRRLQVEIPGFTTREFDRNRLPQEIAIFNKLQSSIFGRRIGYVARTLEEDQEMVQSFIPFLDDELVIIAEDRDLNPVGLLICLPDVYQALRVQQINRARIISIGVVPGLDRKGIGVAMSSHLMRNLLKKGYQTAEASWILENNRLPQNLAKRFNARSGREFTLLRKQCISATRKDV